MTLCREYRSTKQCKQRVYKRKCLESIEYAYEYDTNSMSGVIKYTDWSNIITEEPSDAKVNDLDYFNDNYEQ